MATLGDIARARSMTVVAQETGLGRESLYKSLSADGNPEFATVLKVVRALGLRLSAETAVWPTLACLMAALLTGAACTRHDPAVKWRYDGPGAPEHWASLSEEYGTCADGQMAGM